MPSRLPINESIPMAMPGPAVPRTGSKPLSFFDHLDELRVRLVKVLAVYAICVIGVFSQIDRLVDWIMKPIGQVVFTSPEQAFVAQMNLAFLAGFILALPFTVYHIWEFISLGLTDKEKKYTRIYGPLSFLCFAVGVGFAYWVMIPMSLRFLLNFSSDLFIPMITVDKYISFVGTWIIACGIVFELPLAMAFLASIGIATPEFLRQKRRYAILGILIVSAIITPPDVMSQLLMAGPLILLYEIGIIVTRLTYQPSSLL
jgi:sec-independent protein translocase protein TatC